MENPRKRTTVTMAPGSDGLRAVDHEQQQAYARLPNVTRRQMLTGLATAGVGPPPPPRVRLSIAERRPACPPPSQPITYILYPSEVVESFIESSRAALTSNKSQP